MNGKFSGLQLMGVALACAFFTIAKAADHQAIEQLSQGAKSFLAEKIGPMRSNHQLKIRVGKIDSRLRLHKCGQAIDYFIPAGRQAINTSTLGARCEFPKPWSLYLPVTISIYTPVLVAAHPIGRGVPLQQDDVKLVDYDLKRLPNGYYQDVAPIVGKITTAPIVAGKALTPKMVKNQQIIKRGNRVTIVATIKSVRVSMHGIALANGSLGETIKVKNIDSRKIIQAQISGPNEVKIQL